VDYTLLERELKRVDAIILSSGIQTLFVRLSLENYEASAGPENMPGAKTLERRERSSVQALRCTYLKHFLGSSYRDLSVELAQSALLQWFSRIENFDIVRVPSKSLLQTFSQWLPVEQMDLILAKLVEAAAAQLEDGRSLINLEAALELDVVWVDTTALEANIHMPVDWVLLRDAARTLLKAMILIRKHGLRHRMEEPAEFLRRMNKLCIAMSGTRRQADGKKQRKAVLRQMKRLTKMIEGHARRYRRLLDEGWAQTDWTRRQAEQVLGRMDGVLELLPEAIRQAHERIIGGRQVKSEEKILSLYDEKIHVIVRGKAGAEVEFGNSLFIAEQSDGLILDHKLCEGASPGDARLLEERLENIAGSGPIEKLSAVFGDRGFASGRITQLLDGHGIYNGICPRGVEKLEERLQEEVFGAGQKRRAQTESRIAILKNVFLENGVPRAKGFASRQKAVKWAVLAHNLRLLARLPERKSAEEVVRSEEAA